MEISTIKNEESPAKRQPWKMKPRRSLGLPTESDWKRYFDGFDVPESLNTKMARKKKRLSNIIGKLDAQSEYGEINYSSFLKCGILRMAHQIDVVLNCTSGP